MKENRVELNETRLAEIVYVAVKLALDELKPRLIDEIKRSIDEECGKRGGPSVVPAKPKSKAKKMEEKPSEGEKTSESPTGEMGPEEDLIAMLSDYSEEGDYGHLNIDEILAGI